jgi:hypothetical protein
MITELRLILLMEADFNATNKTIHGIRMLANARKYRLVPEEVFSERNRLANDGTLSKIIIFVIARQLRRPMGLGLVDADNCYNRIAHPMASMVLQAFGVPTGPIRSMLTMLQEMRFFLWTGYGNSTGYVGGSKGLSINSAAINDLGVNGSAINGLGIKRIGSAQHWRSGCLLQHGTILLAPPAALWQQLFGGPAPSLPPLPLAIGELESLLLECAAASFPLAPVSELTAQELAAIKTARPTYRVDPQAAG